MASNYNLQANSAEAQVTRFHKPMFWSVTHIDININPPTMDPYDHNVHSHTNGDSICPNHSIPILLQRDKPQPSFLQSTEEAGKPAKFQSPSVSPADPDHNPNPQHPGVRNTQHRNPQVEELDVWKVDLNFLADNNRSDLDR